VTVVDDRVPPPGLSSRCLGTKWPRNVSRVAAILYGDWGTNKTYVIGLAFAIVDYNSFWLIAAMGVLTIVGINYIIVCQCYPDGGGVYAGVHHRSEIISDISRILTDNIDLTIHS